MFTPLLSRNAIHDIHSAPIRRIKTPRKENFDQPPTGDEIIVTGG